MKWPLSFPCLVRDWPTSRPPQSPSRDRTAAQWPAGRSAATPSVEVPARLSVGWPGRAQSESDTGSQSESVPSLEPRQITSPARVAVPSHTSESPVRVTSGVGNTTAVQAATYRRPAARGGGDSSPACSLRPLSPHHTSVPAPQRAAHGGGPAGGTRRSVCVVCVLCVRCVCVIVYDCVCVCVCVCGARCRMRRIRVRSGRPSPSIALRRPGPCRPSPAEKRGGRRHRRERLSGHYTHIAGD